MIQDSFARVRFADTISHSNSNRNNFNEWEYSVVTSFSTLSVVYLSFGYFAKSRLLKNPSSLRDLIWLMKLSFIFTYERSELEFSFDDERFCERS